MIAFCMVNTYSDFLVNIPRNNRDKLSKFLYADDDDAKAIAKPQVFS